MTANRLISLLFCFLFGKHEVHQNVFMNFPLASHCTYFSPKIYIEYWTLFRPYIVSNCSLNRDVESHARLASLMWSLCFVCLFYARLNVDAVQSIFSVLHNDILLVSTKSVDTFSLGILLTFVVHFMLAIQYTHMQKIFVMLCSAHYISVRECVYTNIYAYNTVKRVFGKF